MMRKLLRKSHILILSLIMMLTFAGCSILDLEILEEGNPPQVENPSETPADPSDEALEEDGYYTSKEDVAQYLHTYGHLPDNYITKNEAMDLGWDAGKGNLWQVTDRMSIGGDRFGNREGLLPDAPGRKWFECDIDYQGGYRNEKRIVFSSDGLIYYTGNHYESFEKLY